MPRSRFAVDLLRPDITLEETKNHLRCKRELSPQDYADIIKNAETVMKAAQHMQTQFNRK